MNSSVPLTYRAKTRMRNELVVLLAIMDKPLTFTELIVKSGLSRSTINIHLKTLHRKGWIKREYEQGKVLIKPYDLIAPKKTHLVRMFIAIRDLEKTLDNLLFEAQKILEREGD